MTDKGTGLGPSRVADVDGVAANTWAEVIAAPEVLHLLAELHIVRDTLADLEGLRVGGGLSPPAEIAAQVLTAARPAIMRLVLAAEEELEALEPPHAERLRRRREGLRCAGPELPADEGESVN
jgi:hypothetical protein